MFFLENTFYSMSFPAGGGGVSPDGLKKICRPRVFYNIPGSP